MVVKISEMSLDGSIGGSEKIPVLDSTDNLVITTAGLKSYVVDQIEAITAGTVVDGSDQIYILDATDGALKPVDIDTVLQHVVDAIWGKTAETAVDAADVFVLKDGGTTEKTVTAAILATYIQTAIEASILDISDQTEQTTAAGANKFLVVDGTTPKHITFTNLLTSIYAGLATYVAALTEVTTSASTDVFYVLQGGTQKKVKLSTISTFMGGIIKLNALVDAEAYLGDDGNLCYVKELETIYRYEESGSAYTVNNTTVLNTGNAGDTRWLGVAGQYPRLSSSVWDGDIADIDIDGGTDIGADLADADLIVVDDGGAGTNRKSAMSRLWTYVTSKIQGLLAKTTPVGADILTIQDSADSNNLKELTITNLATNLPAGVVPIASFNIDAGTDIGADLADADLIVVDDGAGGTNRKSAMSRVWTYISGLVTNTGIGTIKVDTISEKTATNGVAVDGLTIKDAGFALGSDADGDFYYRSGGALVRLPKGNDDDFIRMNGSTPNWESVTMGGWDGNITDIDIDGGTDISADLADADLIVVDDGGAGTNRKSAMSRVWTYIDSKIAAVTDVSGNTWVIDEDDMISDLATKVPTQQSVKAYVDANAGGVSVWTNVSSSKWTATPASTSSVTMSDTSDIKIGLPIRYTIGGTVYYGQVSSITTNTTITVVGAPMGGDITKLEIGLASSILSVPLFVDGTYGDATNTDLLASDMNTYFKWRLGKAYLVDFIAIHKGADTGTEPKINIQINNAAVSTADLNNGVQLGAAATWVGNTAVAINTSNYDINWDEELEVACTAAGGTGDAEHLTVICTFVLE